MRRRRCRIERDPAIGNVLPLVDEVEPLGAVDHLDVLYQDVRRLEDRHCDGPQQRGVGREGVVPRLQRSMINVVELYEWIETNLTRAVERPTPVDDDVRPTEDPESDLRLEREREAVLYSQNQQRSSISNSRPSQTHAPHSNTEYWD